MLPFCAAAENLDAHFDGMAVDSLRFERTQETGTRVDKLDTEGFSLLLENDSLQVYYRPETFGIRVKNLQDGYVWGGLDSDKPDNMNKKWSAMGNALVAITYYTLDGTEKSVAITPKTDTLMYEAEHDRAMRFHAAFGELGISFDFLLTIDEGAFTFRLPFESIEETGEYLLGQVSFIPFFGTVQQLDGISGYILIPDGSGALMRFGPNASYTSAYEKRIWGKDVGVDTLYQMSDLGSYRPNDYAVDESQVTLPIFGMVHGVKCDGYLSRVTGGAEYAIISITPGGMQTDYTNAAFNFIYRQKYSQPISRSGAGVQVVQKEKNPVEAEVTYYLLHEADADYSGMARRYRALLEAEGVLDQSITADGSISMQLDFVVAAAEEGFLGAKTCEVTTEEDMLACLEHMDTNHLTINLLGWQKGGLNGCDMKRSSLRNALNGEKKLNQMLDRLADQAESVYLHADPMRATKIQLDERSEAAITLSQTSASYMRENLNVWLNTTYFIKPQLALARIAALDAEMADRIPGAGLALDGAGLLLYSENLKGKAISRTQVLNETSAVMENLAGSLALYQANAYMLPYADKVYAMPMSCSQFLYETDSVPFVQMVLSGAVEMYAPYMNESFYTQVDLLKHIDYNVYPALILTGRDNYDLRKTTLNEYASTQWQNWTEDMNHAYALINDVLRHTEGRQMLNRVCPEEGLNVTYYEGGVCVAVNYTAEVKTVHGHEILPGSARALEVAQ